ncbi:hypothetical protein HMSSN036_77950 [Paenibacillus macerans]|nr:hypothetical protein HMSSN036_77950 [Paenibacillus macerans]
MSTLPVVDEEPEMPAESPVEGASATPVAPETAGGLMRPAWTIGPNQDNKPKSGSGLFLLLRTHGSSNCAEKTCTTVLPSPEKLQRKHEPQDIEPQLTRTALW